MKSRSQQGHALSDAGGETVPASPLAFWHPLTCRRIIPASASVVTWYSPLCVSTSVMSFTKVISYVGSQADPTPSLPHLN